MNIGFVSTWFERGAAYVTRSYVDLLKDDHTVFVYARGGEEYAKGDKNWDFPYVTWSPRLRGTSINFNHFHRWVRKNKLDTIFFNEQHDISIVFEIKKRLPHLKVGTYVDYYKENTIKEFFLYDFLICNTKRHYSVFKEHPQCYYVPWGTDTTLFKPRKKESEFLSFFHSAGMSNRKGTKYVIDAFIQGDLYKQSKLIIHTQQSLKKLLGYEYDELSKYNIDVIQKTVEAPGLYHLGDVYVYPTKLDGLGLTMYEALSCGLPVITTNHPPMNEVINSEVGYLVDVNFLHSRNDGYYWPLSIVDISSLIHGMKYYIKHNNLLPVMKENARKEALEKWEWKDRKAEVNRIFKESKIVVNNPNRDLIAERDLFERVLLKLGSSYLYGFVNKLIK